MEKRDERLLADFVALFYYERELDEGAPQERAIPQRTDPKALDLLYEALPARLPRLYEQLILSYRWPAIELRKFALLANPPGPGLTGLLDEMKRDRWLWEEMIPRGWIPFAQGPGGEYDPVCFQVRQEKESGDCRVVQLDHEQMLCYSRIVEVEELASSFRELVELTVADAGLSN